MMQARVISGGDSTFDALVYTQPDARLLDYMQNSMHTASTALKGIATNFMDNARNTYERYNSNTVLNAAKALVSSMGQHINQDVILTYNDTNIFQATPIMQQYIMAQPDLWKLNQNQSCNGFDGVYYDPSPGIEDIEEHQAYRQVMDGMLQYDEDGKGFIMTYSDEYAEELHVYDQFAIHNTWDVVSELIAEGIDPSDPDAGEL